jgi:phosphohistidine swiveling domain-containing protein
MAADLASTLLAEALGFGRARLSTLLGDLASDPAALLEALAPGTPAGALSPATVAAATAGLTSANNHATQLAGDLSPLPQTLGGVQAAFVQLAGAVGDVHAAIVAIRADVPAIGSAEDALVALVRRATTAGGAAFGSLVSQLGLDGGAGSVADGFSAGGTTIRYRLANAAARALPGPAGALTLSASTLTAVLDYAAAPPTLAIVLETGVAVGLAGDGFVQTLAGASAAASATVTVTVDTQRGVTFGAGAHNRIDLPGQLQIPGVDLRQLALELPREASSALDLTGTLAGELGPLKVVVDGAGIRLAFAGSPPTPSLTLRPPSGAGIDLDAGLVSGGGFLSQRDGVYGGALDLDLGPIGIKAVGLLRPDPFSLVLVLTVAFRPPIQLSFGFTLNAVGGVLAIQRVVAVDALRAGVHDHTVDTIFVPDDPVAAAPTILAALANVFPERDGGFVVGPLFELGWGSPVSFVTARLGVVLSAAADPTLVLLGSLRLALPAPDAAIVDLRAELYGEITPDHTLVLVSLEGSKVAGFSLSGDFGLLIGYGDDPELAI